MVAIALEDRGLNPFHDQFAFLESGLLLIFGRHDVGIEVLHHLFPDIPVLQNGGFILVTVEGDAPLLLAVRVAAEAILAKHRFDLGLKSGVARSLAGFLRRLGTCGHLANLKTHEDQTKQNACAFAHDFRWTTI